MAFHYLRRAEELNVSPNFWCSEEYLKAAGCVEEVVDDRWIVVVAEEWWLFPPLPLTEAVETPPLYKDVWSDFDHASAQIGHSVFLDYEYTYNPRAFDDMSGGAWMTFRKNCRKWPRVNSCYMYRSLQESDEWALKDTLIAWLRTLGAEEEVHDQDVLLYYLAHGEHRNVLLRDGELVAINIWDSNWARINYRFCIARPEPFLSEFARLLFFQSEEVRATGKLVNDGGVLGKESLKRFKDKMNPLRRREVYSWLQQEEQR